jgi:hypothetical protein
MRFNSVLKGLNKISLDELELLILHWRSESCYSVVSRYLSVNLRCQRPATTNSSKTGNNNYSLETPDDER